jgi:hypothetical protein
LEEEKVSRRGKVVEKHEQVFIRKVENCNCGGYEDRENKTMTDLLTKVF